MTLDITTVLAPSKLRVTAPRQAVFRALQNATTPLGIADVIRLCPDIDRVSVYRTIDTFLAIDIITTVPFGWKQRYELAAPLRPHHHHLYCVRCETITEIASNEIETLINQISKTHTFRTISHTFELQGVCQSCLALDAK